MPIPLMLVWFGVLEPQNKLSTFELAAGKMWNLKVNVILKNFFKKGNLELESN